MDKKKIIGVLEIPPEEYDAFRHGLLPDCSKLALFQLPETIVEWRRASEDTKSLYNAAGYTVVPISVRWSAFRDYAEQTKMAPTMTLLDSYVLYLHYKNQPTT